MTKTIIDDRLQALGITKNYKGYHKLKLALELALEDEFRLYAVSKRLYKPVAEKCGCTKTSVERNIRTITDNVWNYNSHNLCITAGYKLSNKPTSAEFISILVANIQRTQSLSTI